MPANPAPASLSAAKAYLERIRLAAERTGMAECETLLDEMVATFEEAAREREGMRATLADARSAIASLSEDALGVNTDYGYSLRDELLHNIGAALQPSPAEGV